MRLAFVFALSVISTCVYARGLHSRGYNHLGLAARQLRLVDAKNLSTRPPVVTPATPSPEIHSGRPTSYPSSTATMARPTLPMPSSWPTQPTPSVNISISVSLPPSAVPVVQDLVGFSIEQDRWPEWIGSPSSPNTFFLNALDNLKQLSGQPPRIRIGADSEDHTDYNSAVTTVQSIFPQYTMNMPYPEASSLVVGDAFYQMAVSLPQGTQVTWGVSLGERNMTATYLETVSICTAFSSPEFTAKGISLDTLEVGNEPDMFAWKGQRRSNYNITKWIPEWTNFAENVSTTANSIMGRNVPLQGMAFAFSTAVTPGFTVGKALSMGLLNSKAGKHISQVSQHHYQASFCFGADTFLQNLMSKTSVRSNINSFAADIAAARAHGLSYVLGETNSVSCHGAPGVSDTAAAALWALDYAIYASIVGIKRLYFHGGIGYKYSFIQPVVLNRSIRDGIPLTSPLPPHIQPAYYAAIMAAEAIGPTGNTTVMEIDTQWANQVSGYAFYEGTALARVVLINTHAYIGGERKAVHITFNGIDSRRQIRIKRLNVPSANATSGVTWGGQSYDTTDARATGRLKVTRARVGDGVDVHDTEVVMLFFDK